MSEDTEKYTFRTGDIDKEDLQEMAEELDVSLAQMMRDQARNMLELHQNEEIEASPHQVMNEHTENMLDDELYRDVHQAYSEAEYDDFEEFVLEGDLFEDEWTKWMDTESLDYEMMKEAVEYAQRGKFDEAYGTVKEMKEQGFEQEGFLFNTIVSEYRS